MIDAKITTPNSRRGACDRCRGQKLRCVGAANPIFNSNSRFQRNEIPCERCKRAKVDCYGVRPASRGTAAIFDRFRDQRAVDSLSAQKVTAASNPLPCRQPHDLSPQNDRPVHDIDALANMAMIPSQWPAYALDSNAEGSGLDLETSPWMLNSNLSPPQDAAADSFGDHTSALADLMGRDASMEWNTDRLGTGASYGQAGHVPSETNKQSDPDDGAFSPSQSGRALYRPAQQQVQSTRSWTQELAKFNEMLLREKRDLEDASAQKDPESSPRSIGQTLRHSQEFLSILQCFKLASGSSESERSRNNASGGSCLSEVGRQDSDSTRLLPLSETSCTGRCRSHSGPSAAYSSSTVSTSTPSLASAAPSHKIHTLLSILSCYVYILQSYDEIFTPIHDAITRPVPVIPAIMTGLRLDGFELDGHHSLQLECLISVTVKLLEEIEDIVMGASAQGGIFSPAQEGLLGDKLFAGLIDALYEQNEENAPSHGATGKRDMRVKRLIREIRVAMKMTG